jgi:hypothetical protein
VKQLVQVPKGKTELLTQSKTNDTLELDKLGIAVIQL